MTDEKDLTSQTEGTEVHNEEKAPTEEQQKPSDGGKPEDSKETKEPEAPKTYSEEEWTTREREFQSDRDTKTAELNKAHKEELGRRDEESRKAQEAATNKKLDDWVKQVENDGGDVDAAKRVAEKEKAILHDRTELDERKRKQDEIDASQQSTLKYLDAQKLAKEHDIPVETLMEAKSPEEMRVLALTEEIKKLKTPKEEGKKAERPVTSTDKGVGSGGGEPAPETAQGKMRAGWNEIHKKE